MRLETIIREIDLFRKGDFQLHSGDLSWFKIDCNALTDNDIEFLADYIIKELGFKFEYASGIPTGGLRLANALNKRANGDVNTILIVDDVFTTGKSIEEHKKLFKSPDIIIGCVVVFARKKCPEWITPIFQMI